MRVALLCCSAPHGDAIGNQVAEKVAFFLDRGADVRVFLESDRRLPMTLRPFCQVVDASAPDDKTWKFLSTSDLIFVEYSQWFELLNWLPLLAGGKARIVFDYHSVTPPHLWGTHNHEAIEKSVRQRGLVWCADAALIHSHSARQELLSATGFLETWVHRLGYPVDLNRFSPARPQKDWRERLGLGPVKIILYVGRLAPNKRLPIMVEALARHKDQTPQIHGLVVGDSNDIYAEQAQLCRDRAAVLGISDRLHFLGRLGDEELLDAYRSADIFVMPSVHEGFCIPVVEAMACGVPVIASRSAALPETIGSAGLTFIPDDVDDLARQVCRVVKEDQSPKYHARPLRIAVVAFRFGDDFVGGAESSLRTSAQALRDRGHHVEVFTTCTKSEGEWSNELPEGTLDLDGLMVHRFLIDDHDRVRHLETVRRILEADGRVPLETEEEYLQRSIHSTRLIEELLRRETEFDAVIVGPYLHGLTVDVAREFPEKTIVAPCFHDESYSRFRAWPTVYGGVGAIWYHSEEEKKFAEAELGLNHPGGVCVGTWLDTETRGDAQRGRELAGADGPYLVYVGRYSEYKNFPTLLGFAHKYNEANPDRNTFVFIGEGHVPIPKSPWARDLGFVEEAVKRDVVAGAAALLQLSRFESLSLVALEAWAQGTPVIADGRCAVLAGHLNRCGGGRAVDSYESFAEALDHLWQNPDTWKGFGHQGQLYVRETYGSRVAYAGRLEDSIGDLKRPLAERMRERGLEQVGQHSRIVWRDCLAGLVEEILDSPRRPQEFQVEVIPRNEPLKVAAGQDNVLVPVRVTNRGTHAVVAEGPGRFVIQASVEDEEVVTTPLPDLLMPGQTLPAVVMVRPPRPAGKYEITFHIIRAPEDSTATLSLESIENPPVSGSLQVIVENRPMESKSTWSAPLIDLIRSTLAEASRCQRLPDDYTDVTEGRFAKWKRWIKRKLLGNFKHAYVDVLSRQQTRFNQQILTALTELADYCATLEHAARAKHEIRNPKSETSPKSESPMFESSDST